MYCPRTRTEVEPIDRKNGILECPACGELLDEATLEPVVVETECREARKLRGE